MSGTSVSEAMITLDVRHFTRAACLIAVVAACLIAFGPADPAPAAGKTFTTETDDDEMLQNGFCSFREALNAARENGNANPIASADCGGAGSATETDTIRVIGSGGGPRTYPITILGAGNDAGDFNTGDSSAGPLVITRAQASDGFQARFDANDNDRVFNVGAGGVVTISNLTLLDGNTSGCGGGVMSAGSLTLSKIVITSNVAGTDGGGVCITGGSLSMTDTSVTGNTGASGTGVGVSGGASGTMSRSLVTGSVSVTASSLNITNSTIDTSGTVLNAGAGSTVALLNATLAGSGSAGLVQGAGTITAKNTIFSNGAMSCGAGTITTQGHNLDSGNACELDTGLGDLVDANLSLGALASNGGPTQTHALLAGSPAIDAGDNTGCPATDQRGSARPTDGDGSGSAACDIGAYEAPAGSPTPTPSPVPTPSPTPSAVPTPSPSPPPGPTFTPTPTASPGPSSTPPASTTATATTTPTQTPTVTPTQGPTHTLAPTPTGNGPVFGDINCDRLLGSDDAALLMRYVAGVDDGQQLAPCSDVGEIEPVSGLPWGDLDCDEAVNGTDVLFSLARLAGLQLSKPPQCPAIGAVLT